MLHQPMDQIMPKMPHETDGLIFQPLKDVSIRVPLFFGLIVLYMGLGLLKEWFEICIT